MYKPTPIVSRYSRRVTEPLYAARLDNATLLSLIVENNMTMRRPIEALGARIAKMYRVYEKVL